MALTADDRLILLRIKVERAKHHLRDLERELLADRGHYRDVPIFNDDAQLAQGTPDRKLVPIFSFDVLTISGDVVYNLRSALDHLTYQLVIVGIGKQPSRQIKFPVAEDRNAYEAEKSRKIKGVRPEVVEAFDLIEPYKGGRGEIFWRLHELNNIDKHRFFFTLAENALFHASWYSAASLFLIRPRTFKTDAPQFSGVLEPEVDNEVDFVLEETLTEPQIGKTNLLLNTLHKFADVVEKTIFSFRSHLE